MIPFPKARILALSMVPLLLTNPPLGVCSPAAAATVAPTTQTAHISITSIGSGPTIVLIPGLASPGAVWDGVVPDLARTHRVLVVQVNGFSGDAPGANTAAGMLDGIVADLDAYLVANKIRDARIVGHSMGGLVALMFAKAHPDHVARLMIVDALPYVALIFAPTATVPMVEPTAKAMAAHMVAGYGKPADMAAQTANAQRLALKPESVTKVAAWGAKADPRVVAEGF